MQTAEAFIDSIKVAFAGVLCGLISLHEAQVIDDYGSAEERAAARLQDTATSWEDVPDADIESCPNALSHLDGMGWKFYIPAYMIWSLRHFRVSELIVSDFTIYSFALSADPEVREYMLDRFRTLDNAQSRAVCQFLRYMAANDEYADSRVADEALKGYWDRFC